MLEIEKLFKEYEKLSYDERREMLSELYNDIYPALEVVANGMESFEVLVLASCSADGKLSVDEYSLIRDATGLDFSYDRVAELVASSGDGDIQKSADGIVDFLGAISKEIKSEMVSFCICLCSADNRVTMKEKSFIKKLLK